MSTFHGLPAHILLNHFIVVLTPLTAILAILCVLWPAVRRRFVWLVLSLAVVTVILTPLTSNAGKWLLKRVDQSPTLDSHAALGDTMIYFSLALVVAAVLVAVIHVRQQRGHEVKPVAQWPIAALVVVVAIAAMVQVYRIGEAGARAAWGNVNVTSSA